MTVRQLLRAAIASVPVELRQRDGGLPSELLLAHVLGVPRSWLYAHPERQVDQQTGHLFRRLLRRYARGEPLEHIVGRAQFHLVDLEVTPAVLVPRPETESLVDLALDELAAAEGPLVVDVGTGSGAIALAIARASPRARIIATDISARALAVAARNVQRYRLADRVWLMNCDLLPPISARPDLIVANLPYVATADLDSDAGAALRHEPRLALHGGDSGLDLIGRLLEQCAACLTPAGVLLAEIGRLQGAEALGLARRCLPDRKSEILPDQYGLDRFLRVGARHE